MHTSTEHKLLSYISVKPNGCWEWMGSRTWDGYGRLRVGEKTYRAHRVSYELFNGPIQEGMFICHTCDNPSCVNPQHLFQGSNRDNILDAIAKGHKLSVKGENHGMSRLSSQQVSEIRNLYLSGVLSQASIGLIYGISQTHVGRITRGERWGLVNPR